MNRNYILEGMNTTEVSKLVFDAVTDSCKYSHQSPVAVMEGFSVYKEGIPLLLKNITDKQTFPVKKTI